MQGESVTPVLALARRCGPGLLGWLLLAACAGPQADLPRGAREAEVRARLGTPTGSYALGEGARRLEFATGPYGRTTWMADIDAGGHLLRLAQVLREAQFHSVQDGMGREDLLRLLGRPGEVRGKWRGGQIWHWRYPTNDCLWAVVDLDAEGRVQGGVALMPDPRCDAPNDKTQAPSTK